MQTPGGHRSWTRQILSHFRSVLPNSGLFSVASFALPLSLRFFEFAAECLEDFTVRTLYRRIVTVERVDTQLASHTVEVPGRTSPRANVVPKCVLPYVKNNVPTFRRSGMRKKGGGRMGR